jgi:hypothetical protein
VSSDGANECSELAALISAEGRQHLFEAHEHSSVRTPHLFSAIVGKNDLYDAPIIGNSLSVHEPPLLEPVHDAREGRLRRLSTCGEIAHASRSMRERTQHPELLTLESIGARRVVQTADHSVPHAPQLGGKFGELLGRE